MRCAWRAMIGLTLATVLAAGCKAPGVNPGTEGGTAGSAAPSGTLMSFPIRGKIVSVDAAKGSIVLDAEAVPGFMEAMAMPYKLKDPSVASELHPGDRITATLLVRKTSDGFEDPQLDQIVITSQARPDYKPAMDYHVPTQGDAVPDFKLVNENGKTIHLAQFKGRVVLLTFIYTRCPLADYCPRMNKNFAQIDQALASDKKLYGATHLISVSFDPKNDTPAVLKRYGGYYTGGNLATFTHWDFASAPENELATMEQFFDLGVTPGDAGTLTHSLSTTLIGKDGKVLAWYPTNEWQPADVLAAMKTAAA